MSKMLYQQFLKIPLLAFSLISGILLIIVWPTSSFALLAFIAFVPILILFDAIQNDTKKRKGIRFAAYTYLALLIWNVGTTYWVYNSTAAGGLFAMIVNALLMTIPFIFFYIVRKKTYEIIGLLSFISFYLLFEYWHINWQLAWPWLTLGNAFAKNILFVQWYEYTGVFGGSLWILLCNTLIYVCLKHSFKISTLIYTALTIALPIVVSVFIYYSYNETGTEIEVVVVQPNLDPYNEKFRSSPRAVPYEIQFDRMLTLSEKVRTPQTRFILWPETALPGDVNEAKVFQHQFIPYLFYYSKKNNVSILTGIDSHRFVDEAHKTVTSRKTFDGLSYYDSFNAALLINPDSSMSIYHKSRMVPGVESLPYPEIFGFVSSSLGGIVQSIGKDSIARALKNGSGIAVAPVICYESIFGEYVSGYVTNGANFIGIITNDGWWGNTQGYKQHFQYARLRAIEQRKSVARAANTGTSGFIDQRGNVLQENKYWVQDALVQKIKINSIQTFYAKHGDYIGFFALILSPLLFIYSFFSKRYV
ncbi:apolipoprotein N-acyltransferase [Cytophaga aurantiaca]|uniref:apolipoprotein N-acyltransferase n=1 Tax=Cytophaga aurantiaca TaxID=29530 RepID=UPI0004766B97|nr:apolipoprotein N-acyltransferase [Cytophaga aurantiaca]